ncbi:uncharacterized protein MYCFIDRAFT_171483 [Pseudocercospora fijiensis CIRAD86]|uniref:Uncharacterized protein n=1 Tax=Pseudocercospora fijiensis (strain CIRAD86) TaxID=383855 RepID=M3A3B3_PSEFD|nr:uncharacterized protein MYCFIDRAFT_171483 [Pseudocercospora fijiensis CIRAD86]EME85579.1 hypothetical protein MYCFIDRAFT_171483 [Pseudocercospora fijiensis CIRAD86]
MALLKARRFGLDVAVGRRVKRANVPSWSLGVSRAGRPGLDGVSLRLGLLRSRHRIVPDAGRSNTSVHAALLFSAVARPFSLKQCINIGTSSLPKAHGLTNSPRWVQGNGTAVLVEVILTIGHSLSGMLDDVVHAERAIIHTRTSPDFNRSVINGQPYCSSDGAMGLCSCCDGLQARDVLGDYLLPDSIMWPFVGGHDWGVGIAYKMPIWYPDLVKAFFTVSVPYTWVDLSVFVENGTYPLLGYQLQWRDFAWERNFQSRAQIRDLLNGAYGGLTQDNQSAFSPYDGYNLDQLPTLQPTQLINFTTLDIWFENFAKQGFHGLGGREIQC